MVWNPPYDAAQVSIRAGAAAFSTGPCFAIQMLAANPSSAWTVASRTSHPASTRHSGEACEPSADAGLLLPATMIAARTTANPKCATCMGCPVSSLGPDIGPFCGLRSTRRGGQTLVSVWLRIRAACLRWHILAGGHKDSDTRTMAHGQWHSRAQGQLNFLYGIVILQLYLSM